jgi:BON domain
MKNDILIQQEVVAELERDHTVPNGSVGVEVHHGVVKLASTSTSPTIKQSAELAARRVQGISGIVLDMGVAPLSSQSVLSLPWIKYRAFHGMKQTLRAPATSPLC